MVQAGLLIPRWRTRLAGGQGNALALAAGLVAVALVAWNTWPPLGWAFAALVAWAAFPAWLFHASMRVAAREGVLAAAFSVLAPVALVGGVLILAWQTATRGTHEVPLAIITVPLGQLAIALPFVLNTSTDTKLRKGAKA